MDMSFTPEQIEFRDEVRAWLGQAMPKTMQRKADNGGNFEQAEVMAWHRILAEKGWIAPTGPRSTAARAGT